MYNDDEHSSMDNNINTEQSLMNNLSCQDLNGRQLSHGWYWILCSPTCSEPHIWMMVLYYSSFVVNTCRSRVAVATVTLIC